MMTLVLALSLAAGPAAAEDLLVERIAGASRAFVFIEGGSGVLISPDGLVLTCEHVINRAPSWEVFLTDGRRFRGTVLGRHFQADLAVLRLENARGLPYLPVAEPAACRVGEPLIAIGNPFLLGTVNPRFLPGPVPFTPSVSRGIVSGMHRFGPMFADAIECDTALNPGNSGGPLINVRGEIMGIGSRIASRFGLGANTGVGYGASAGLIRRLLPFMVKANGELVEAGAVPGLTLDREDGRVVVREAGARGGVHAPFEQGDVVVSVGNVPVRSPEHFTSVMSAFPAGEEAVVWVRRGRRDVLVRVMLAAQQVELAFLGVDVEEAAEGLTVRRVLDPARQAGIAVGDVLQAIGENDVISRDDVRMVLLMHAPGDTVTCRVLRGTETRDIEVSLGTRPRGRGGARSFL